MFEEVHGFDRQPGMRRTHPISVHYHGTPMVEPDDWQGEER